MVERRIKIIWEERMDNRTLSPEALSVYRRKAVESVIKALSQSKKSVHDIWIFRNKYVQIYEGI